MKIEDYENNPQLAPCDDDLIRQAALLSHRYESIVAGQSLPNNGALYERASDAAELMVVMLLRNHRSQSMMKLVADELANAIAIGW